jgi:DNA-binding CsgD family transcriptional regulator
MLQEPEILNCAELIAQAALEPAQWTSALAAVATLLRSEHAVIFSNKESWAEWPFKATAGLDDDDLARFFAPETMPLWEPLHRAMRPGAVVPHHEVAGARDFERTELYNDIIRPTGTFYGACFQHDTPDLSFHLNVCRRRQTGAFQAQETRRLQALTSHMTLAFRVHHKLSRVAHRAKLLAAALDGIDEGTIIVDAKMRPLFINAAAQSLLKESDGIALGIAGLRGASRAATDRLSAALTRAALPTAVQAERITLPRRRARLPLLVDILPIGRFGLSSPGSAAPAIAIFLRETDARMAIDRTAVSDVYRLTAREAEILALLADGQTVGMIASRLRLAKGTVRNNLKRIFEKTEAHSQVALLARLRSFDLRHKPPVH